MSKHLSKHRDAFGFSFGWWPTKESRWQLSVGGSYGYAYYIDINLPLLGDWRIRWAGGDFRPLFSERMGINKWWKVGRLAVHKYE